MCVNHLVNWVGCKWRYDLLQSPKFGNTSKDGSSPEEWAEYWEVGIPTAKLTLSIKQTQREQLACPTALLHLYLVEPQNQTM